MSTQVNGMDMVKQFSIKNNIIKGVDKPYETKKMLGEMIFDVLNQYPDHIGQIDVETGRKRTFADLKNESIRIALWLRKQGVKPNDIVVVCSQIHPDVHAILLAVLYVGAIYSPWLYAIEKENVHEDMVKLRPKVIFGCKDNISTLTEIAVLENVATKLVTLDDSNEYLTLQAVIDSHSVDEVENFKPLKEINPEDTCTIVFTSGTTGKPKGAVHTYRAVLVNVIDTCDIYKTENTGRKILGYFLPSWNVHIWFTLASILSRDVIIVHEKFDVVKTSELIEKYKVDILFLHTYHLNCLCYENANHKYKFDSVKIITPVGAAARLKVLDMTNKILPNAFLKILMGTTEIGTVTEYTKSCKNRASCGHVLPNMQVKVVVEANGKILGPNSEGLMYAKTPGMMKEYYKNTEATKKAFDSEGWYYTGDAVYYDENGELVVIGRAVEIIKYREYDIHASTIESILIAHPGVMDVAVVPVLHPIDIERPMAFVTRVSGSKVTEDELVEFTSTHGYNRLHEGEVHILDELPRSPNGKVNKRQLKLLAAGINNVT